MWLLLMIVFNQPYTADHINLLGEYPGRQQCTPAKHRAVKTYNEKKRVPAAFGCMKLKAN